jgi:carbonic anhydrase/acetyltransferase-like protein (isoleucine patch superfamily)
LIRSYDGKAPRVHPTAFVSEFADVIGDVEIGEGSSVWPGAQVLADRGAITIGKHSNVQDNTIVRGDGDVEIGDRVVIGHLVTCNARSVGDRVLLGSGSKVGGGAEIGEDSLVASGSEVPEDMVVPAVSLVVGAPGRIRGTVPERHTKTIAGLCDSYIDKAQRYKRQGNLESERV